MARAATETPSVLAYVPLTNDGMVPEWVTPGARFVHEDVHVDAALAELFLAVNAPFNRPVSWRRVEAWAQQMIKGKWDKPHPQGFVFSSDGELIDGQHRCHALIMAAKKRPDVHLTVPVHHNYPPDTYRRMDGGSKRQAGQMLSVKNGRSIAAAISLVMKYQQMYEDPPVTYTQWKRMDWTTIDDTVEFLDEYPDIVTSWKLTQELHTEAFVPRVPATAALFLIREAAGHDPDALAVVHEFVNGIAIPHRCKENDPRQAYARNMTLAKVKPRLRKPSEALGLMLRAWEMFGTGERKQAIYWRHGVSEMPDVYVPPDWAEVLRKWGITP